MSKTNRKEVAKRLTQEIAVTTDPKVLIQLTRQLAKVLPKQRSPRKLAEKPEKTVPLPDGNQVLNRVVVQVENKCKGRGGWNALTRTEKDTLLAEATKTLSAEEYAAVESLNTNGVA